MEAGVKGWRALYRVPLCLVLIPLVVRNYRLREQGELPDEWYWADQVLVSWGVFVQC